MLEANVLYSVTAAVVLGLVTWVAVVLKTAKEPWARELPQAARVDDDVPLEAPVSASAPSPETEMTSEGAPAPALEEKAEVAAVDKPAADAKPAAEDEPTASETADADAKAEPAAKV